LWRNVYQASRGDAILDEQYKNAVAGGFGEFTLFPEFESAKSFNQVLRLQNVPNVLTVVRDPECTDPCGADANWVMIGGRISTEKYEALYPDAGKSSFSMSGDSEGWFTDKEIRVVDYYERIPVEKTIALLSDGRVIDYTSVERKVEQNLKESNPDGKYAKVVKTRKVQDWKVRWVKVDGSQILDGPEEYDWRRIPSVRIPGRYVNIEGKQKFQSAIRHSKDAQRSLNFHCSDVIERSGLISKAPYLLTPKMVLGYEQMWNNCNAVPRPYMLFNIDPANPAAVPVRQAPIDMPAGSMALIQMDVENLQATTGAYDVSMGNADAANRVSGTALVQHNARSDMASSEFIDNYGKAVQLAVEMFMDMAPTVYDSERIEQLIGADGTEKAVTLNQRNPDGSDSLINDLKNGSYTCTATIGPSYQTERQEALDSLLEAAAQVPMIGEVSPDLIAKVIDTPEASEIAKRIRKKLIAQGVVDPTDAEKKAMGPAPPPDPMHAAEVALTQAKAMKESASAHIETSKAQTGDIQIRKLIGEVVKQELANMLSAQEVHANLPMLERQTAAVDQPNVPADPGSAVIPGQ
jgi:hypothetical protein